MISWMNSYLSLAPVASLCYLQASSYMFLPGIRGPTPLSIKGLSLQTAEQPERGCYDVDSCRAESLCSWDGKEPGERGGCLPHTPTLPGFQAPPIVGRSVGHRLTLIWDRGGERKETQRIWSLSRVENLHRPLLFTFAFPEKSARLLSHTINSMMEAAYLAF